MAINCYAGISRKSLIKITMEQSNPKHCIVCILTAYNVDMMLRLAENNEGVFLETCWLAAH